MEIDVIGFDSAVDHANIGLVYARINDGGIHIEKVWDNKQTVEETIGQWCTGSRKVLMAIDCPMGWPQYFAQDLNKHTVAGTSIKFRDGKFPRRETDLAIHDALQITPLDIACSLIARTAIATLDRLEKIRTETKKDFGLIWHPDDLTNSGIIEVYPRATLTANFGKDSVKGYKGVKKENQEKRDQLLERLSEEYTIYYEEKLPILSEHNFDALICCLAAFDFMQKPCIPVPDEDSEAAKKEGWIWVKQKQQVSPP